MYYVKAKIQGVSSLLHHAFTGATVEDLANKAKNRPVKQDYSLEWMDTMYVSREGYLYQPASHIEGSMRKAAVNFKDGKKSLKDPVKAFVYVQPDQIIHRRNGEPVVAPNESLLTNPTDEMCVNVARVVVNRAAVARARLELMAGWELEFTMEIVYDDLRPDVLKRILENAGVFSGIGDNRPRNGRFNVTEFEAYRQ